MNETNQTTIKIQSKVNKRKLKQNEKKPKTKKRQQLEQIKMKGEYKNTKFDRNLKKGWCIWVDEANCTDRK